MVMQIMADFARITGLSPDSVTPGLALPPESGKALYSRLNWTEIL